MMGQPWLTYPRCPGCGASLDIETREGLALCSCGLPIDVEVEVTARWRVSLAPVLRDVEARRSWTDAVVGAIGKTAARAIGWVA